MLIAGSLVGRTAHSPCNPRDVVIVQGFRGHFANAWPRTDRICGEWNLGTCDRKSGSPVRRERDRFCSAVKQPATTTAYFPRPTVCARRWWGIWRSCARHHGLPPSQGGDPRRRHRLSKGAEL